MEMQIYRQLDGVNVRVVMMGLWPHEGRVSGGVSSSTISQVREIGKSKEPEFCFVSFSPSSGTSSEGYARIILVKRRRIYYAAPFLAVLKLWLEVRKLKPEIIHVRGGNLSPYLVLALFFFRNAKSVVTFGSCRSKELVALREIKRKSLLHFVLRWFEKQTALRSDLIVALTSRLAEQIRLIRKDPEKKTIVVPNGVDTTAFNPEASGANIREQLGLSKTDFVIFHAKGFVAVNGQRVPDRSYSRCSS